MPLGRGNELFKDLPGPEEREVIRAIAVLGKIAARSEDYTFLQAVNDKEIVYIDVPQPSHEEAQNI